MKRYCKNIQLDKDWIMACMLECFSDKWKRRDVAGFLAGYQTGQPLSVRAVSRLIQEKRSNVDPLLESINRNILECKGKSAKNSLQSRKVLIETYWNVKDSSAFLANLTISY